MKKNMFEILTELCNFQLQHFFFIEAFVFTLYLILSLKDPQERPWYIHSSNFRSQKKEPPKLGRVLSRGHH